MRGKFVVAEGIDYCGKTIQLRDLYSHLKKKGYEVLWTMEPGGTPLAEKIRDILLDPENKKMFPLAELFLYEASRAQLVNELIKPRLDEEKIVLSERFYHSTIAYQGYGRGLDIDMILKLNEFATKGIRPDLTIIFDIPVEVNFNRRREAMDEYRKAIREYKGGRFGIEKIERADTIARSRIDRIESEDKEFYERVRGGYLELPDLLKDENIVIVNSNRPIREVFEETKKYVEKIL